VERHNHCLSLQIIVLQKTLLDDQIAVLALGRGPLANLDEASVEAGRLFIHDLCAAESVEETSSLVVAEDACAMTPFLERLHKSLHEIRHYGVDIS